MTQIVSEPTWVFAHGSLMFDPGFEPSATMAGRARGWERRFGQPSVRNWGTGAAPAPTSSLSRGPHCDGLVLALPHGRANEVLESIVAREANDPVSIEVSTASGSLSAFTWLMSDSWATLGADVLAVHAVKNVLAGGGPRGDAWQYATGVRDALARHDLDDPFVTRYLAVLEPAVSEAVAARPHTGPSTTSG